MNTMSIERSNQLLADEISAIKNGSVVTDCIEGTKEYLNQFVKFWQMFRKDLNATVDDEIPADLLFSSTIPIMDMKINVTDYKEDEFGSFRIVIREDYSERISIMKECVTPEIIEAGCMCTMGLVIFEIGTRGIEVAVPFGVMAGDNNILVSASFAMMDKKVGNKVIHADREMIAMSTATTKFILSHWYGIELALLHPQTKEIFANPTKTKREHKELVNMYKIKTENKTKYVRKHVVTTSRAVDEAIGLGVSIDNTYHHHYTRHKLIWRVIGHWRFYKNGNAVFVNAYWKGPLRETQKEEIQLNKRTVDIPTTI